MNVSQIIYGTKSPRISSTYVGDNLTRVLRIRAVQNAPLDDGLDLVPGNLAVIRVRHIQVQLLAIFCCTRFANHIIPES